MITETDLEEYYESGIMTDDGFDSVAFAQDAKPLPCWCRGVERVPLEELPLYQYLKAQSDNMHNVLSSTNGIRIQGLGRGRPRNDMIVPVDNEASSSDDDDLNDLVGRYWRRQQPLSYGMSSHRKQNNLTNPPVSRRPPPRQSPAAYYERPPDQTNPALDALQSNPAARVPTQCSDAGASVVKHGASRLPASNSRKGSFNPQEYKNTFSLNHWIQTHTVKGASHVEDSDDDDDDLVFEDERRTSVSSSSPVLSSAEDSAAEQACALRKSRPWKVLEISNLPQYATSDLLGELLADFGVVESISVREDETGNRVAEVRMVNEALLDWMLECLLTSSPFGPSSEPLIVRILGPRP